MYVFMYVCMYSFLKGTPFEYLLLRNGTPLTYLVENFASLLATASALSLKMNVSQNHALRSQRFQDFFTAINTSN